MDDWMVKLGAGAHDAAWDSFIHQYRRLLFAAIRHYVHDHDDVMDVFARVCEALRENELRRLRAFGESSGRARFSTWLATVVHRLTVDWLRQRDGRHRPRAIDGALSPLQQQIFRRVFMEQRTHLEAFGLICAAEPPGPSYRRFLAELRTTYQAVGDRRPRLPNAEAEAASGTADVAPPATEFPDRPEWLGRALDVLSHEDRVAVELYVVDQLPAADIARILGLSGAKAVYNRVYRALDAVRAWLEGAGIGANDL
jgi:RNA polymerase sigma factor (sigma-70 family)